jgi:hypothetical protein
MKPRHAAALALVGWYLMLPPASSHGGNARVHSNSPLRRWARIGNLYSNIDCEKARERVQRKAQNEKEEHLQGAARMDANIDDQTIAALEAACQMKGVSEDDPRIKGIAIPLNPAWSRFIPAKRSAAQGKE